MNLYEPARSDNPRNCFEEEQALLALRVIYREAGLSDDDAWKSAIADYEQTFGPLVPCAA